MVTARNEPEMNIMRLKKILVNVIVSLIYFWNKQRRRAVREVLLAKVGYSKSIIPQKYLRTMEIQITEQCNLNCQSCTHFSPLADKEFLSFENFEKDMKRLSELTFGKIRVIHILGGEPLLNPECCKYLETTRKYFPNTLIKLITNGILLPRQTDRFYSCLALNDIILAPTKYPINVDFDTVREKCNANNVAFSYFNDAEISKTSHKKPLDLDGKQQVYENFFRCGLANVCVQLVNGKLYTCPTAAYIRHFNNYFNQNLVTSELDYIDIYDAKDYSEILKFLAKPIPFCRYCNVVQNVDGNQWKTSKREITEWV
jgi:MoaA/NifB/PqqE/SkfB family radical SAM enzyme